MTMPAPLTDSVTAALNAAPTLQYQPGVAIGVGQAAQSPDQAAVLGQAAGHAGQVNAFADAVQATKHHSSWLGDVFNVAGDVIHTAENNPVTGSAGKFVLQAMGKPLQEVQHEYRYLHAVYVHEGVWQGLLHTIPVVIGGVAGGFLGGTYGAVLGAELAGSLEGHADQLAWRNNSLWTKTADGGVYANNVSFGRDVAALLQHVPVAGNYVHGETYSVISGLADGVADWEADPLIGYGAKAKAVRELSYALKSEKIATMAADTAPRAVGNFAAQQSRYAGVNAARQSLTQYAQKIVPGNSPVWRAIEDQAKESSTSAIQSRYRGISFDMAADLAKAKNTDQVLKVWQTHAAVEDHMSTKLLPTLTTTSLGAAKARAAFLTKWHDASSTDIGIDPTSGLPNIDFAKNAKGQADVTASWRDRLTAYRAYVVSDKAAIDANEVDPAHPNFLKVIRDQALITQNRTVANKLMDYSAHLDTAGRLAVYRQVVKNNVLSMIPDDTVLQQQMLGEIEKHLTVGSEGLSAGEFGRDINGERVDTTDTMTGKVRAAVWSTQTGKVRIPNYMSLVDAARTQGAVSRFYGPLDSFAYRTLTSAFFKPLALLTPAFAIRVSLSEALLNAFRDGPRQYIGGQFAQRAATLREKLGEQDYGVYNAVGKVAQNAGQWLGIPHTALTQQDLQLIAHNVIMAKADLYDKIARGLATKDAAGSSTWTESAARLAAENGQRMIPEGISAHESASLEAERDLPAGMQTGFLKMAANKPKPRTMLGDDWGILGPGAPNHDSIWTGALNLRVRAPEARAAAEHIKEALDREPAPVRVETGPAEPAGHGLPPLYHGSTRAVEKLGDRYQGRISGNLFGPGFYTTESGDVARGYARGGTTYSVHHHGEAPNLLNLDEPAPDFVRSWAKHGVLEPDHLDAAVEDHDTLDRIVSDPKSSAAQIIIGVRRYLGSTGEVTRTEADEIVADLTDEAESRGFHGFQHVGGKYAAKAGAPEHNVRIFFNPESLELRPHGTVRPATSDEAFAAMEQDAIRNQAQWLMTPAAKKAIGKKDMLLAKGSTMDLATRQVQDLIAKTFSPETRAPHTELLDKMAAGEKFDLHDVKDIADNHRPVYVEGADSVANATSTWSRLINSGFDKLVSPIIDGLSRKGIYVTKVDAQYRLLRENAAHLEKTTGVKLADDELWDRAKIRAVEDMLPDIHNVYLRSQFSDLSRNFMPFYFAQEQAIKRWGRAVVNNPATVRRLQLLHHAGKTTGVLQQDPTTGQESFVYPIDGLANEVLRNLAPLGINGSGAIPIQFRGSMESLNTIVPGQETFSLRPAGPVVAIPALALQKMVPDSTPAVQELLKQGADGGFWQQVVPNTFLRNMVKAYAGDNSQSYLNAQFDAMRAMKYHGLMPTDEELANNPQAKQHFLSQAKNWTRIALMLNAVISSTGLAATRVQAGDTKITDAFRKQMQQSPDIRQAFIDFMAKNPNATPYTVFNSDSQTGATLPAGKAALQFLNDNGALFSKYPNAASWLFPQVKGDQFSQSAYNEQAAFGIRQHKDASQLYNDLYSASADQDYYNNYDHYQQAIAQAGGNTNEITDINRQWRAWVQDFGNFHPIWYQSYNDPARVSNAQEAANQLGIVLGFLPGTDGKVEVRAKSPQVAPMRGLYEQFMTYAQTLATLQAQGQSTSELKSQWKTYLDGVAKSSPELQPVISRVFKVVASDTGVLNG